MSVATKLEYLNDTKQLLKENINNLGGNLTTEPFRQYASVLEDIYERIPKVSGIGASLSLSPTMAGKIKLNEIQGNTLQNGTPTPDTPVPIQSVTGLQNVNICGKNLWSSEWEQGYIDGTTGQNIANNQFVRTKGYLYVIPNTHYAINRDITTGYINVRGYDKNKNFVGAGGDVINLIQGMSALNPMNSTWNSCVIAPKENVYYLRFNDSSNDLSTKYMMVKGDTPTTYKPYKSNTYEVNLGTIELNKIGDYEDYIFKNEPNNPLYDDTLTLNSWYITKNIGKFVLDGTESWETQWNGDNIHGWRTTIPNLKQTTSGSQSSYVISNNYETRTQDKNFSTGNYGISNRANQSQIIIKNNDITSQNDFTTWLSTHNTTVLYQLATPIYETITNTTLIEQLESLNNAKSKDGTTNINVTSEDLSMILNVSVIKGDA